MTRPKASNVLCLLDLYHILYQAYTHATTIRSAEDVARVPGTPASEAHTTLVVLPPQRKALLMVIPRPWRLDLKRLARALGTTKLRMAT
jgi:prolyl-tRNA editing enzyme YbaK/EbsC (Cys-tRNA(Pro) deacylase)